MIYEYFCLNEILRLYYESFCLNWFLHSNNQFRQKDSYINVWILLEHSINSQTRKNSLWQCTGHSCCLLQMPHVAILILYEHYLWFTVNHGWSILPIQWTLQPNLSKTRALWPAINTTLAIISRHRNRDLRME